MPSGIPGIGLEIEGAMQHAPQSGRQSIKNIFFGQVVGWAGMAGKGRILRGSVGVLFLLTLNRRLKGHRHLDLCRYECLIAGNLKECAANSQMDTDDRPAV
ncbi:hypothetical protein RGU70_04800 [Herbaspirillum sp. RTI4]|uniref:hypothetical protein n=1 Tax=Herbaspirillum sp. RTI4 TaxID=3048640 RepID=UPI002AB39303|nr:hypothetical protein [Herbaspirillum sp. RTI4]MDY7577640.1 hypothetical protein [Herbaspirillum sp. RTI4]MEA9982194.1 hypothetical protein [Herbaspirillum sp. RTI4]